jgi:GntR family transcriptional regulator/MocR family aminotransferase
VALGKGHFRVYCWSHLDQIAPDAEQDDPLHRQIYAQLRAAILSGRLAPGQRVPATRGLAEQLGLSRNTVARAYDDLLSEGYLEGRVGAGTFVSAALVGPPAREQASVESGWTPPLSPWAGRALSGGAPTVLDPRVAAGFDFRPGTPEWDAFPRRIWWRLLGRRLRAGELGRYADPAGYPALREAIASHLAASRAVVCTPEQVAIVNGTQQAIDLLARLLVSPGDRVVVEEPGYPEARRVLAAYGATIVPVPVDARGLRTEALPSDGGVRLVYVTPSHQFPTGATLSLDRRLRLLEWARRHDALVIEDDYDSEFRYAGRPVESLQGLERTGRVVYLGTFSSVLFPPLRVGYVVLPIGLVEPFVATKWLADRGTGALEQQALADFIVEGHFSRHLRRMRRLGRARRDALLASLRRHLGSSAAPPLAETGTHVLLSLRGVDEGTALREASRRGVGVYPVAPHYAAPAGARPGLLLGYASLPEDAIEEGVRRLGEALRAASR